MDIIKMYYYTGIPVLTCNMLFYSITSLSQSITSSQNVVKFITEQKECDSSIYKNELEISDLPNKLKIVEALIFDIIKKYCKTDEEFYEIKTNIDSPLIKSDNQDETGNFQMIEYKRNFSVLERVAEPIRYALLSTAETVKSINDVITRIQEKIQKYNQSYLNKIVALCLKKELKDFNRYSLLLDKRVFLLLELLKVYSKNNI